MGNVAKQGILLVISGPSGVGKSTVARQVLAELGAVHSISVTTRAPRAGEQDGRDYCFVDAPTFRRMIDEGRLLEHAEVFGNFYGTPAEPVKAALAEGHTVLLEIDVQGGIQVGRKCPGVFVLLVPPSEAVLTQRLTGRGTDAPEVIARRLAKAQEEMRTARESGIYNHEVVNDRLDDAVSRVVAIVKKEMHPND